MDYRIVLDVYRTHFLINYSERQRRQTSLTDSNRKMSSNRKNRVSRDPDDILSLFVDNNGRCKICRQDHSHTPTFNVQTSMDVTSELFGKDSKPKIVKEVLKHA